MKAPHNMHYCFYKVKQKMHGYIMTVDKKEEFRDWHGKDYVMIRCITDTGNIMKHNHKEVDLVKE